MAAHRKKIGIMGGTFDPVHVGHLILGEKAYEQLGLDSVWFMPSGNLRTKGTVREEPAMKRGFPWYRRPLREILILNFR